MNQKQSRQKELQELTVAKAELTGGDTSGLVFTRSSKSSSSALLLTPRVEALKKVEEKISILKQEERR